MKKAIIAALLLFSCQISFAEYAVIDRIVYNLDFANLTATVLNFQTSTSSPCDVTIPEAIKYKNDIYRVTRLSYYAFDYDAISDYQMTSMFFGSDLASYGLNKSFDREHEEMKYKYNYKEARACIEHLNLPNTLEDIKGGAFDGMIRLKTVVIPASVKTFSDVNIGNLLNGSKIFSNNSFPRLETITILGTPICSTGYNLDGTKKEITVALQNANGEYTYVSEMAQIVAEIDPLTNKSKLCPNLKSFSMPAAQSGIAEAIKNQSLCSSYNSALEGMCAEYNTKLKEHTFYDSTKLVYEHVKLSNDKGIMEQNFKWQKEKLSNEYNVLIKGKMEENLHKNNKSRYIQCYKIAHPEKKTLIDSLSLEYRCYSEYAISDAIIRAVEGKEVALESCREKYIHDSCLFANRAEYDERYNMASSNDAFLQEIHDREYTKRVLEGDFKYYLQRNPSVKLQGMSTAENNTIQHDIMRRINHFKKTYYYAESITMVLSINEKAKKEYEKNSLYFGSPIYFFEAYISPEYKTILKAHKSQIK